MDSKTAPSSARLQGLTQLFRGSPKGKKPADAKKGGENRFLGPEQRGRDEWRNTFGDLDRSGRNFRTAFWGSMGLNAVLVAALVGIAAQSRVAPYVVQVDRLGQVTAYGPVEAFQAPDRRMLVSQLSLFIRNVRTVYADPFAQRAMVGQAFWFVDGEAQNTLDEYLRQNNPLELGRELMRDVEITSVLPIPGTESWKVEWRERTRSFGGGVPTQTHWQAFLRIKVRPPTSAQAIQSNPLGVYVTAINWTQVSDPQPASNEDPTQ